MKGPYAGPRLALVICGLVVAVDQGAKAIATALVERGDHAEVLPFLAFENTRNSGIAFGLADGASPLLIAAAITLVVALLAFVAVQLRGPGIWVASGLLVGGALGNLADRARDGAVTDFIDLPAWPTFNLADMAIVAGVLVLVLAHRPEPTGEGEAARPG